jgi:TM2 domain-containing membrane protein YozV
LFQPGLPGDSGGIPVPRERKNRVVAILLAWFLGLLGIHHFYLGNSGKGALYLVLSLLVLPIPVIAILCIIDIITIATSKDPIFE